MSSIGYGTFSLQNAGTKSVLMKSFEHTNSIDLKTRCVITRAWNFGVQKMHKYAP